MIDANNGMNPLAYISKAIRWIRINPETQVRIPDHWSREQE